MIPVTRLVYEFKRKLNHRNTDYSEAVDTVAIGDYLNEAQSKYFENRVENREKSKLAQDDLRPFERNDISLKLSKDGDKVKAMFEDNHYQTIREYAIISKDGCGTKRVDLTIFSGNNYDQNINNTLWESSYEWEDLMTIKTSFGFQFLPRGFNVDEVIIDFYRKPNKIYPVSLKKNGPYISPDGEEITEDSGSEFTTTFAAEKITDLAVLIALRDIGDIKDFQTQMNKIINTEKIYN